MEILKTKNKLGYDIVMCCASCIHNAGANNEFTRLCDAGEGIVKPSSYCKQWEIKRRIGSGKPGDVDLDSAGLGGGRIKRRDYLQFVLKYPQPENPTMHIPIGEIRADYEKKHGSIYINL